LNRYGSDMKDLWGDIARHRGAAVCFAGYWLATVVTVPFAWHGGIPIAVVSLLLSNCLISGALISWWRGQTAEHTYSAGSRIREGALVGMLVGEMTLLVMKGGAVDELIGWMRGRPHFGQWGEVLEFAIAVGLIGALLGSIGAACSTVLRHRSR
jgi:hypothetical protein